MKVTREQLRSLISDEQGQDVIEYAVLAALIALVAVAAMHTFDKKLAKNYKQIGKQLKKAR